MRRGYTWNGTDFRVGARPPSRALGFASCSTHQFFKSRYKTNTNTRSNHDPSRRLAALTARSKFMLMPGSVAMPW